MSKHPFSPLSSKWQTYESTKPTGSLIVSSHHPVSPHSPKFKLDDLLHKQNMIARHSSEEEFRKCTVKNYYVQPPYGYAEEATQKINSRADKLNLMYGDRMERNINSQIPLQPRKANNSKGHQKEQTYFKCRNSGGRPSPSLKETSSTASTQLLTTHKSQKTFPSFIRNQNKSPDRYNRMPEQRKINKDSFKIIKRLGQGKFGSVFLAREKETGMMIALKSILKKKIIQQNLLQQFTRELKIQTFLEHPNIIKTYGFFPDEENLYTIMELGCDGQLYDIISSGINLSEETTSFIIGNLLDAVGLLHKHKILHRDIKPQNIVLVHGNVKLCDFGWAVNKKEELRSTFCGTPLYLSPQLLQGSKYDQKVDLWAIGILAYELNLGCSPFNINEQEDLYKIVTDQVQFPPKKKITKEFKEFIRAILKKNPKQRLSCKQLLGLDFIRKYRQLETCQQLCN